MKKSKTGARSTCRKRRKRTKSPLVQMKARIDRLMSQYIRAKNIEEDGLIQCATCETRDTYKNMQCGHFMSRRYMNTRWAYNNMLPQCKACNMFNQGRQWLMGREIDKRYGNGTAQRMHLQSRETKRWTLRELNALHNELERKVEKYNPRN